MAEPVEGGPGRIRVGVGHIRRPDEERLRLFKQLGVNDVSIEFNAAPRMLGLNGFYNQKRNEDPIVRAGEDGPILPKLIQVRRWIEEEGLRLAAVEGFPGCSTETVMYGREGMEDELERLKQSVRAVGRAGISVLGYDWSPYGVGRTSVGTKWRGGAKVTEYRGSELGEYRYTVRAFQNGFLVRITEEGHGLFFTVDDISLRSAEEAAEAVSRVLAG